MSYAIEVTPTYGFSESASCFVPRMKVFLACARVTGEAGVVGDGEASSAIAGAGRPSAVTAAAATAARTPTRRPRRRRARPRTDRSVSLVPPVGAAVGVLLMGSSSVGTRAGQMAGETRYGSRHVARCQQ